MRRRLFLGTLLTTAAGTTAGRAADGFSYGNSHVFAAWRNGQQIGHHALRFHGDHAERHVTSSIDFSVRVLGFPAYKFAYRCHEVWRANVFQSLEAETDDDGKKYTVRAQQTAQGVEVTHDGPVSKIKIGTAAEMTLRSGREVLPAGTLPSTHWNIAQVRHTGLLHTEYGTLYRVAVAPGGRETIRTVTGTLAATRYEYTGELRLTQWFDDHGRWVKGTFLAPDNSTIEYILQE